MNPVLVCSHGTDSCRLNDGDCVSKCIGTRFISDHANRACRKRQGCKEISPRFKWCNKQQTTMAAGTCCAIRQRAWLIWQAKRPPWRGLTTFSQVGTAIPVHDDTYLGPGTYRTLHHHHAIYIPVLGIWFMIAKLAERRIRRSG